MQTEVPQNLWQMLMQQQMQMPQQQQQPLAMPESQRGNYEQFMQNFFPQPTVAQAAPLKETNYSKQNDSGGGGMGGIMSMFGG